MKTVLPNIIFRAIGLSLSVLFGMYAEAQAPQADFSASVRSGCGPLTVRFEDRSTGNPRFWNWDFGNGILSNQQNPSVAYAQPGVYTVTLVVRNEEGVDGETKTGYITVYPSPTAAFNADLRIACLGSIIQFTDRSTDDAGSIVAWEWDFGDGTTSNARNPQKQYSEPGFYTVTLQVTSSTGCTRRVSQNRFIRILPGIENAFRVETDSSCRPPFPVRLINETSGPGALTFSWTLGNGASSTDRDPQTSYPAAGSYSVRLITTSEYGCSATLTKDIEITGAQLSASIPSTVCLNSPVQFQNTSSGATSSYWEFGDGGTAEGETVAHQFNAIGTYPVKLITDFGSCRDSVEQNVVVRPLPDPSAFTAGSTEGCSLPFSTTFTAPPGYVSAEWDFGDGTTGTGMNPSHTYTLEGSFAVQLTVTDASGCTGTSTHQDFITVRRMEINTEGFYGNGCVPYSYRPTVTVNSLVPVTAYTWNFGDGTTSSAEAPTHVYSTPGTYTVTLTVRTASGCEETIVVDDAVHVGTPPIVDFTVDTQDGCVSQGFHFTDLSSSADEWQWDFGDGNSSGERNPTHNYSDTGFFSVTLTAIFNGCPQRLTKDHFVHINAPVAAFDFTVNCSNIGSVAFVNQSQINASEPTVSYEWNFGDPANTTSVSANPGTFVYPGPGHYTVRLNVTNGACSHQISRTVAINNDNPTINLSNTDLCPDQRITISAENITDTDIRNYRWSINNGPEFGGGRSFDTSFSATGTYDIRLVAEDINGCETSASRSNAFSIARPTAEFRVSANGGCAGAGIVFTDNSQPANLASRRWHFGDGTIGSGNQTSVTHTYSSAGDYDAFLVVEDSRGCKDSSDVPVTISISSPRAGFMTDRSEACAGVPIQFSDTSSGSGLRYAWDFGDGETSDMPDPQHIFARSDNPYIIKLRITDANGCSDSVTQTIRVSAPTAAFTATDSILICPPAQFRFASESNDYTSLQWNFGNGNTASSETPSQFYNSYGDFLVTLYAFNSAGCVDSTQRTVRIQNPYLSELSYSPITACNELTVDFDITPSVNLPFVFNFGDRTSDSSGARQFSHHYEFPNFYAPSIQYTDNQGCTITVGGPQTIRIIGAVPTFGADKKAFCDEADVYFTNYTIGNDPITGYQWDFRDGSTSTDENVMHRFTRPGTYPVQLTVTTEAGCVRSYQDTIRVYSTPAPTIAAAQACVSDSLTLSGSLSIPDTAVIWNWRLSDGRTLTDQHNRISFTTPGTYTATLTASNTFGCTGTPVTGDITVFPLPEIIGPEEIQLSSGNTMTIPFTYSDEVNAWEWSPATGLSCTGCPQPVANPQNSITYRVDVSDENGCRNSKEIRIIAVCNNLNLFVPNTFSPNNDGNNDVFYPRGKGIVRVNSFSIYNRWGQQVYQRRNFAPNDANSGWRGDFNGKPAPSDTYVYVIEVVCENSVVVPFKGNVTLIR